jgi:outer membrane protein
MLPAIGWGVVYFIHTERKMMLKHIVLGALCLLTTQIVFSQKKTYTLKEVWQKTLLRHPALASKKALVERQELSKDLTKKQALPKVNVQAQQSYGSYQTVPGSFFPLPGLYNTSGTNRAGSTSSGSNFFASAVLQWDFLQFGRIDKRVEVADAGIQLSNAALSNQAYQLQVAGTRYYFAALYNSTLLKVYKAEANRLSSLLELLKAQSEAGLLPGADTLLLRSAYLQSRSKINEQQALFDESIVQLAALMGEDTAVVSVDTTIYYTYKPDAFLQGTNVQDHPFLQYLTAGVNQQKAELDVIRKEPYPSVGLLAGTGVRGSGINASGAIDKSMIAPWANQSASYLVGIGITWNLSSLYENKTRQQMAKREIESAKADYDVALLQINALHATAMAGWKQQRQRLKDAQLARESSLKAYDLYTVRYENGLINLIELLQLQRSLQDSELNYAQTTYAYWNELINQANALGNPTLLITAIQP